MSRYRWLVIRNRAAAALFVVVGVVALVALGAVVTVPFPHRSLTGIVAIVVATSAALYGLTRWRWLHALGDRMLAEERRAYLDERGISF